MEGGGQVRLVVGTSRLRHFERHRARVFLCHPEHHSDGSTPFALVVEKRGGKLASHAIGTVSNIAYYPRDVTTAHASWRTLSRPVCLDGKLLRVTELSTEAAVVRTCSEKCTPGGCGHVVLICSGWRGWTSKIPAATENVRFLAYVRARR